WTLSMGIAGVGAWVSSLTPRKKDYMNKYMTILIDPPPGKSPPAVVANDIKANTVMSVCRTQQWISPDSSQCRSRTWLLRVATFGCGRLTKRLKTDLHYCGRGGSSIWHRFIG